MRLAYQKPLVSESEPLSQNDLPEIPHLNVVECMVYNGVYKYTEIETLQVESH